MLRCDIHWYIAGLQITRTCVAVATFVAVTATSQPNIMKFTLLSILPEKIKAFIVGYHITTFVFGFHFDKLHFLPQVLEKINCQITINFLRFSTLLLIINIFGCFPGYCQTDLNATGAINDVLILYLC